jgi:dTDP-4-amino-4,6-dideoxygalactose transaminase
MLNTFFSPWPSFTNEEAESVKNVLLSNKVNYWTGNEGRQFEQEFSKYTNCKYAIALTNGTVALELTLHCLGITKNDEVIVTPRTFLASASAIVMCGAIPVFAEVDTNSQNITPETIKAVITSKTKAIITVHLAGWSCDMDPIMNLANKHNIKIIEDCAQAHGAKYKGRSIGSLGHVAAWSFCQDKIMTTGGEGGMVTTNDEALWKKMWAFKDHGKSYDTVFHKKHSSHFRWLHESFGTNWRLTEMQSAIGRIQTKKMSNWHQSRTNNANQILDCCSEFPDLLRVPRPPSDIEHAWYKCYVFLRDENLPDNWNRDRIIEEINQNGIPCFSGSCSEVYKEKAFDGTNFRPKIDFPIAKKLGKTSLMFLVHPTLTRHEMDKTCDVITTIFKKIVNN